MCVADGDDGHQGERTRGRMIVSAAAQPEAYVVDLDTNAISTVGLSAPGAFVNGSGMTSYGWIVHYMTDHVEVLDVGSYITPHEDHFHVSKRDPRLHSFSMTGSQPTHVVNHDSLIAVYFDGIGEARLLTETQLVTGGDLAVSTIETNMPHHGVAVPAHGHLLITVGREATPEDQADAWGPTIPTGVAVHRRDEPGTIVHETEACTKLHGEAIVDAHVVYGCDEGVLIVTYTEQGFQSQRLAWPSGATGRAFDFRSHASTPYVVGDFGPALVRVDPDQQGVDVYTLPMGNPQRAYAFAEDGEHLLALGEDGYLYRLSLEDFSQVGERLELRPAFAGATERASLVVAAGRLYAVDQRSPSVSVVDLDTWAALDDAIELPSEPATAAVIAVSPDW